MPDYDTSAVPNGVKEGLDQISRTYANGKIADNIVRVNPEMLSMLQMGKEEFGSLSSADKSSAITGAITAIGLRQQQAQAKSADIQAQLQQMNLLGAQRGAAGRAGFNADVNDLLAPPASAAAPDSAGAAPAPAPAPGMTPEQLGSVMPPGQSPTNSPSRGLFFQPQAAQPAPGMTPQMLNSVMPPGAPAAPQPMTPAMLSPFKPRVGPQDILRIAAKNNMVGDPQVDKVLGTMERFDPERFAARDQPPTTWTSKSGNNYVVYHNTIMADKGKVDLADLGPPPAGYEFGPPDAKGNIRIVKTAKALPESFNKTMDTIGGDIATAQSNLDQSDKQLEQQYKGETAADVRAREQRILTKAQQRGKFTVDRYFTGGYMNADQRDAHYTELGITPPAPAAAATAPAGNGNTPPAVQAELAAAQAAIAKGKDPVAVKALLARKLKTMGYTAP